MGTLKCAGIDLLKGIGAAAFSFVGLALGGMIVSAVLRLPQPAVPVQADMKILMPLMLLTEVLLAILLGECFQRLYSRFWQRLVWIWLCTYLLYYLLNILDGLLFTPLPNMSTGIVTDLFPALFAAAAIAFLWRPKGGVETAEGSLRAFWASWKPGELIWRLALAWLIFPPLYYLVGRGVAVFTLHYYTDHSLGLGLTLPPLSVLMAMEVLRGVLFLLAVLPVLVAWRGSRRSLGLWVTALIFCQIAATMIVQAYWLPAGLRIPHSIELLVDSAVQACLYVLLLGRPTVPVSERSSRRATEEQYSAAG
jgi:hypothetical protein